MKTLINLIVFVLFLTVYANGQTVISVSENCDEIEASGIFWSGCFETIDDAVKLAGPVMFCTKIREIKLANGDVRKIMNVIFKGSVYNKNDKVVSFNTKSILINVENGDEFNVNTYVEKGSIGGMQIQASVSVEVMHDGMVTSSVSNLTLICNN